MKMKLEDYCRTLSTDEISKLIGTLHDIKRERKMAEMNDLLDELEAIFDKIEEKGYTIYFGNEIAGFDDMTICE